MIVEQHDPDGIALLHHDGLEAKQPVMKEDRYEYWHQRCISLAKAIDGMKRCKERQSFKLKLDEARRLRNKYKV